MGFRDFEDASQILGGTRTFILSDRFNRGIVMNQIFKICFNRNRGAVVVASEAAEVASQVQSAQLCCGHDGAGSSGCGCLSG